MTHAERQALIAEAEQALKDFSGGVDARYWSRPLRVIEQLVAAIKAIDGTFVEEYSGVNIFTRHAVHPDGTPDVIYFVSGWIGTWYTLAGCRTYIDWRTHEDFSHDFSHDDGHTS